MISLRKKDKLKVGISFSGGGARGFAHLGAIKAFEEFGIKFDFVSGTSAGSLVGALYAAGLSFDKMLELAKKFEAKDIRTSKFVFIPSKPEKLEQFVIDILGNINIEDLPTPLAITAVDLKTTNEICFKKGNLAKAVAGSCAVPGIFQPVEFENFLLADGGLKNTLPADIPKIFGCDFVVGVDVNKSRLYGTDSPKLLDVLACSLRILMESNVFKGYEFSDIILKPETKRFKSTTNEGFLDMIEEGYRETINKMPEILKLFNTKPIRNGRKKKFVNNMDKPVIF